jgi:hypothetical protein
MGTMSKRRYAKLIHKGKYAAEYGSGNDLH